MKKTVSISLLFIFLFNLFGFWIVFKIRQNRIYAEVRKEIKKALKGTVPENELHLFKVTEGNLPKHATWVKLGKEFKIKDNMYDVVRSEEKEGETILYCINDKQEEALFANLDEHIENHITGKSKSKSSKSKVEKKANDFYDLTNEDISNQSFEMIKYFHFSERVTNWYLTQFSPPPELV